MIVVGAGIIGVSAAYHLAKLGVERPLLVERRHPASGSSGLGAGIVGSLAWNPLDVKLVARSRRLYEWLHDEVRKAPEGSKDTEEVDADAVERRLRSIQLEAMGRPASTPASFTYNRVGSMTAVAGKDAKRLEELTAMQRAAGARVEIILPEQLANVPGLKTMDTRGIELVSHCPDDGWAVTTDATNAMATLARRAGVELRNDAEVGLSVANGSMRGVHLSDGTELAADRVIVAGGIWTKRILGKAGVSMPLAPYPTQASILVTTGMERCPAFHDTLNGVYWRGEGSGRLLVGDGTGLVEVPPDDFPKPPTDEFKEKVAQAITARFPKSGWKFERAWMGACTATPDRHPLVGGVPGVSGLFVAAGANGFGFMRGPALGEAIADIATGRTPPVDIGDFDPARFRGYAGEPFAIREGFTIE